MIPYVSLGQIISCQVLTGDRLKDQIGEVDYYHYLLEVNTYPIQRNMLLH